MWYSRSLTYWSYCEEVLPSTSTSSVSLREGHCHSFRIISCLVEMIWSVPGSCCGIKAMIVLIGPSKQLGTPNAKPNHNSREEVGIRIEVLSQRWILRQVTVECEVRKKGGYHLIFSKKMRNVEGQRKARGFGETELWLEPRVWQWDVCPGSLNVWMPKMVTLHFGSH